MGMLDSRLNRQIANWQCQPICDYRARMIPLVATCGGSKAGLITLGEPIIKNWWMLQL